MPAVDFITVKGFRSIAAIEKFPLRPINLLIGANGSGKSNFIGVFALLHEIRAGRLQEYVRRAGGANRLLHFGSKHTERIELRCWFGPHRGYYQIHLHTTNADTLAPTKEGVQTSDTLEGTSNSTFFIPNESFEAQISKAATDGQTSQVQALFDRWRSYHFHDTGPSSPMKRTARVNDNRLLRPDGENLPAFLYLLRQRHSAAYQQIRRTIQQVAPFFDDFALEPDRLNPETIRLEWKHEGTDAYFDTSDLSDGTLRFIALATLLLQPDDFLPSLILIDEPELGLHPAALNVLAGLVKKVSHRAQVIVSTQSSLLLDHFEPEDVVVADRKDGATELRRLESGPLKDWLEEYSLGQLWEKNELGGRPVPEGTHGTPAHPR